jgi:hypothetical protein
MVSWWVVGLVFFEVVVVCFVCRNFFLGLFGWLCFVFWFGFAVCSGCASCGKQCEQAMRVHSLHALNGFFVVEEFGKRGFVCGFQELCRFLVDGFVVERCQSSGKDFVG